MTRLAEVIEAAFWRWAGRSCAGVYLKETWEGIATAAREELARTVSRESPDEKESGKAQD
jgi:hypothetical protein